MSQPDCVEPLEEYFFDAAGLGVLVLSAAGTVLRANPYWQRLCSAPLTPGASIDDFLAEVAPGFDLDQALANPGEAVRLNVRARDALPATLYFRVYATGDEIWLFAEHDQQEAMVACEQLLSANNELNNLARELHKQRAELVRLNDLKNRWLGMAAHDLRNPISVITGMAGILQHTSQGLLSPQHLDMLARIRRSSAFMIDLINDLLDVAKIESGKLELNRARQSLPAVVARAVELNRMLAEPKNIKIRFDGLVPIPEIEFDDQRIEQVLNNLLANAVKFSEAGTVITVEISTDDSNAIVKVADQGPGIPEAERDRLFQPFSRTSVQSTGGEKSTGLGLAIVRKVIEGHRGRTWVESQIGVGSSFFFSLPLQ